MVVERISRVVTMVVGSGDDPDSSVHLKGVEITLSKGRAWPPWPGPTLIGPGPGPDVNALARPWPDPGSTRPYPVGED